MKRIKTPKGLGIYQRLAYIEQTYPELEFRGRELAQEYGYKYFSYNALFNPKSELTRAQRYRYARQSLNLISGRVTTKKNSNYMKQFKDQVFGYIDNEKVREAILKGFRRKGKRLTDFLADLSKVNLYYKEDKVILAGKKITHKHKLSGANILDNKIIDDNYRQIIATLKEYNLINLATYNEGASPSDQLDPYAWDEI